MRSLTLLGVLLSGCQLFFSTETPPECLGDTDCLDEQYCDLVARRCELGARAPLVDAAVRDMAQVDLGVEPGADAAPVDAAPDAAADLGIDAAPPPFRDGCFAGDADGTWVANAAADTHVPRGICTPTALIWSQGAGALERLSFLRAPGDPASAALGPLLWPGSPLATDGVTLVFLTPWPDAEGPPTAVRLDLVDPEATPLPLSPTGLPNGHPARAPGVSAHVEQDPEGGRVVLTFDDDSFDPCRRPGAHQWGVALGQGRAAWFERIAGRTSLVVTDTMACEPRVVRPIDGRVEVEGRVAAAGAGFYWIEADRQTGAAAVRGLSPDARGRLRPTTVSTEGTPIELAGGLDRLAIVSYQPALYTLDLFNPDSGALVSASGRESARHPTLAAGWLIWAEAGTTTPWELKYARLDDLGR